MPPTTRGCGRFRLGERHVAPQSILAAALSPVCKAPYGNYDDPVPRSGAFWTSEDGERRFGSLRRCRAMAASGWVKPVQTRQSRAGAVTHRGRADATFSTE